VVAQFSPASCLLGDDICLESPEIAKATWRAALLDSCVDINIELGLQVLKKSICDAEKADGGIGDVSQ